MLCVSRRAAVGMSNKPLFFQSFLVAIAEGYLAIIVRTTRAGPTTTLAIDRLRQHKTISIFGKSV